MASNQRRVLRLYRNLLRASRQWDSEGPFQFRDSSYDLAIALFERVQFGFRQNATLTDPNEIQTAIQRAEENLADARKILSNTYSAAYPVLRMVPVDIERERMDNYVYFGGPHPSKAKSEAEANAEGLSSDAPARTVLGKGGHRTVEKRGLLHRIYLYLTAQSG